MLRIFTWLHAGPGQNLSFCISSHVQIPPRRQWWQSLIARSRPTIGIVETKKCEAVLDGRPLESTLLVFRV